MIFTPFSKKNNAIANFFLQSHYIRLCRLSGRPASDTFAVVFLIIYKFKPQRQQQLKTLQIYSFCRLFRKMRNPVWALSHIIKLTVFAFANGKHMLTQVKTRRFNSNIAHRLLQILRLLLFHNQRNRNNQARIPCV